jgi:broad specificity phosphatase PhoE
MSTLVFIRHGEIDMAGRFCGHSDPELNAAGEHDAMHVAEAVSKVGIERIYSSDLRRASQTAAAIARYTGIEVNYLTELREIYFGQWEGLAWQEIEVRFPEEADLWLREFPLRSAPGGEAYPAFTARIDAAIATLLRETAGMASAVVTHRGVMRYALSKFFGFAQAEAWTRTAAYGTMVTTTNPLSSCEVLP